jgi:hypothetical protein
VAEGALPVARTGRALELPHLEAVVTTLDLQQLGGPDLALQRLLWSPDEASTVLAVNAS